MKRDYTQAECREMWEALLTSEEGPTLEEIEKIDKLTPWSNIEPKWWLDMMQEYKRLLKIKLEGKA